MAKSIKIIRNKDQEIETLGEMFVYDGENLAFKLATVEKPWKNNKNQISCIPVGTYDVEFFNSPKHGACFLLKNVPGRSMIEIHAANYERQLLGCIAPGLSHADIDKDGLLDVVSSKAAMDKLIAFMPKSFKITIS